MAISTSSSPTKVDGKDAPWYKTVTQRRTVGWVLGAYLKVDPSVPVKLTEQELIAQFPSLVKRDGGVLSLTLADGQIKKLDNVPSPPEGGGGINYHFEDYFRDTNQFLIHWGDGWESAGFYFVDQRTGVQTQLEGKPIFSPNKRKILSIGYNPTSDDVLHIWIGRIHSGEIFNDFKDDSLSYILRGGFWLDDSTIAILGDPMDANNNVLIFLRYIGKQWVLEKMELK